MNEELFTKPIGNKEIEKLQPKEVTVVEARIEEKGAKNTPLLVLSIKHPDEKELITLSKVQFIDGKNLKTIGLWISLDDDENIQKGSAIARFMDYYKVTELVQLKDKLLSTAFDEKNYLCIKAY